MRNLFAKLWNDDRGNVAFEYLALVTVLGLGLIVGFATLRNAIVAEYTELSEAVLALNQSYSVDGLASCAASVDGIDANDTSSGTIDLSSPAGPTATIDQTACP